jgi:hypothetical protein
MAKPIVRVSLTKLPSQNPLAMRLKAAAKPKAVVKPIPKPNPATKTMATAAESAAIGRANRSQAMEAREMRTMGAGRKAPQVISTTVRERTTPMKKK